MLVPKQKRTALSASRQMMRIVSYELGACDLQVVLERRNSNDILAYLIGGRQYRLLRGKGATCNRYSGVSKLSVKAVDQIHIFE